MLSKGFEIVPKGNAAGWNKLRGAGFCRHSALKVLRQHGDMQGMLVSLQETGCMRSRETHHL